MTDDTITFRAGRAPRPEGENDYAGPDGTRSATLLRLGEVITEPSGFAKPKPDGTAATWSYRIWTFAIDDMGEFDGQVLEARISSTTSVRGKQYQVVSALAGREIGTGVPVSLPELVGRSCLISIKTNDNDYPYIDAWIATPVTRKPAEAPRMARSAPKAPEAVQEDPRLRHPLLMTAYSSMLSGDRPEEVARIRRYIETHEPPPPLWEHLPDAREMEGFEEDTRSFEEQVAAYRGGLDRDLLGRLGVRRLDEVSPEPPPPMLFERLDPGGHSILFGDGDTGKGVLASWWCVRLVEGGHKVLILDYEDHPQEWSSRIRALGGKAREDIHYVAPLARSWTGPRGPLWAQAEDIVAIIDTLAITYVLVDSIVPASFGYDPLKPETASLYSGAVQALGIPVLSLAHATKAGELKYPFGSVFWHNLSRTTWSARKVGGEGHRVLLTHRKHNTSSGIGRLMATITWHEDVPGEVDEQPWSVKLAEAIIEVMGDESLTVTEIVTRLNEDLEDEGDHIKPNSVLIALRRGSPDRFTIEGKGKGSTWKRA